MSLIVESSVSGAELAGDFEEKVERVVVGGDVPDAEPLEQVIVLAQLWPEAHTETAEGVLRPKDVSWVNVGAVFEKKTARTTELADGGRVGFFVQETVNLLIYREALVGEVQEMVNDLRDSWSRAYTKAVQKVSA
jgi:hypothetical protein